MARAPFKLKSGNASTFKNLGSSPVKQDYSSSSPKYTSPVDHPDGPAGDNKPKLAPKIDVPKKNEGKLKKTGKKRSTIDVPKDHPVTPPTDKQSKKSKGTVKGLTNFEYDMKPVTNVINKVTKPYKKLGKKALEVNKKINPIATYKKVKKYFTKK